MLTATTQIQGRTSILRNAIVEQSAAKIGIFGPGGSGKSLTATLIALALSKTYHNGAPVVLQDTEGASDWLIPVYQAEGVELHRIKSKSFVDMRQALREGEQMGACAFIGDSYSHPWQELQGALKKRLNVKKLEVHHMQELQDLWQEWVEQFLNSPLHCILAGRLAYEWENDIDSETGKMGFHKAGTKMRSERDAGYEPHLLLEMDAVLRQPESGHFLHRIHVLKDRSRILNGHTFEFGDINDYRPRGWQSVLDALQPHFANMNIGGSGNHAINSARSSAELFDDRGQSGFQQRARQVQIALEEIEGTLVTLWPGQDAKSKELKRVTVETLFHTRSWTAVESKPLDALEFGLATLRIFELKTKDGTNEAVIEKNAAVTLLERCKEAVFEIPIPDMETVSFLPPSGGDISAFPSTSALTPVNKNIDEESLPTAGPQNLKTRTRKPRKVQVDEPEFISPREASLLVRFAERHGWTIPEFVSALVEAKGIAGPDFIPIERYEEVCLLIECGTDPVAQPLLQPQIVLEGMGVS